jgi:hypothetical protein
MSELSEYKEKFVEWDIPERRSFLKEKEYTPMNPYQADMNVSNWKSEARRSFEKKDSIKNLTTISNTAAGIKGLSKVEYPPLFSWQENNVLDANDDHNNEGFFCHKI